MSEVQRLADEEATRAEAENPDEATPIEPVEPGEPTEEEQEGDEVEGGSGEQPAPPAPDSQKEAEQAAKKVLSANTAHAKRVGQIFGEEAATLIPCPRCTHEELPFGGIMGFVLPLVAAPVPASVKGDVLASVGESASEATEPDKYARQCDSCKGAGVTLSGSKRVRDKLLACHDCDGRGWIAVGPERQGKQVRMTTVESDNGTELATEPQPEVDLWGTPIGDPEYGVMPQYRRNPLPALTAG